MGKGSLRYPASAIAGGRFNNAVVRGAIVEAATNLADTAPVPLDGAIAALSGRAKVEPKASMQALGRLGGGVMNKTEGAYADHLMALQSMGSVLWFRFEGLKLRLADKTFYTPDFAVIVASGAMEFHEVKGHMTDDAAVKIKTAARQYPFVFKLVRKGKGGVWDIREV
ncbi:hypothetical protein [Paraburkholderia sp. J10-1]|uniref:hypothetical protein n=1 Tax=Paraburkholderia sp. J10-1 TaxID=2805430 RepID=UPI002AB7438B|nr:hypothetical protein [Paraburkholderia sp. J10-1]